MAQLTLKQANTIVEKALAKAREMKIKPLGVVVLDTGGHLVAAQREDGASMFRLDVAMGKAWGAVGMGASSRALGNRAKSNPNFFLSLAATSGGRFLPQTGAVVIKDQQGNIIGSAGASGGTGDEDEACCAYGVQQAGLVADASEQPMLNVGVYGLGGWGKRLVAAVQGKSDKIRVVACAARTRSSVEQFARDNGIDIVEDYAGLLKDSRVQGVILATPHTLHPVHVQQAARAGKHVFVEKPLALNAAEAAEAVRACREHKVQLGVGFNRRFRPAMQELRRLATSGSLGRLLHLEGQFSGAPGSRTPGSWRVSRAENPGGSMTARGAHVADAMISIAGPVSEMLVESSRNVTTAEHDDRTSMLFRFASGVTGYLATLSAGPDFWRVHVFGEKGWAEVRDESLLTVCAEQGAKPVVTEYPATDTLKAELEAFADAAAGGVPHPVTPEEAVNSSAILGAIEKSAASGAWVKL